MQNLQTETHPTQKPQAPLQPIVQLLDLLEPLVEPLGYELVHGEVETHRARVLRIFIDFSKKPEGAPPKTIGIEDCVKVTRTIDEPLDQKEELLVAVNQIFHGASYELEVSSPGVDRPLRQERDFLRFIGREARIHTYRALSAGELANDSYHEKNPKQKNFLGALVGMKDGNVVLKINLTGSVQNKVEAKKKTKTTKKSVPSATEAIVQIPLSLISKANLEPDFEI
jgi:ribosome maturation factor RimP